MALPFDICRNRGSGPVSFFPSECRLPHPSCLHLLFSYSFWKQVVRAIWRFDNSHLLDLQLNLVGNVFGAKKGLIVYHFSELVVSDSKEWHQIRGAQMILTMKAISVAFDYDEEKTKKSSPSATSNKKTNVKRQDVDITAKPSVLEYFGFALCPGTCVFGPWTTYKDYMKIFESPHWVNLFVSWLPNLLVLQDNHILHLQNFQWCLKLISSLVLANVFLTVSTCWLPTTVPDNSWM